MSSKERTIRGYNYKLTDLLGKGSYADVYKCTKEGSDEVYAMKVFKRLEKNNSEEIKNEVSIVQQLNHPNIIRCIESFQGQNDPDMFYAVFEYCGKGNLNEYVDGQKYQKQKIPELYAKSYIYKILDALIYIHQHKIAHRDLKLANILINDQYEIKLADFGLSRSYQDDNMLDTICGTPMTMAPEVLNKEKYSEKCDTWSFGVISYYIIYLVYPFQAKTIEQLKKVITAQKVPKFPESIEISDLAKDFLKTCLTIDHKKRPSVRDLSNHKWFKETATSKIRNQFMQWSMGDSSNAIEISNHLITSSINQQVAELIKCTNLSQNKINSITKGFEEFYPKETMSLFLFYSFAIDKVKSLEKGVIKLIAQGNLFQIPNCSVKKLSQHLKHILQILTIKVKNVSKQLGQIDKKNLQRCYQMLVRFVVDEGYNYIDVSKEKSTNKLRFLSSLLNFLNSTLQQPTIEMNLNSNDINQQQVKQINSYIENILKKLNESQLLKIINNEENSCVQRALESEWSISYSNRMKKAGDDETWSMVGEIVERALSVKELIERDQ